jgi:hypothetical protein
MIGFFVWENMVIDFGEESGEGEEKERRLKNEQESEEV